MKMTSSSPVVLTICKGCRTEVDESEVAMCVHCLSEYCGKCEVNCLCQQTLNRVLDAEEAAAALHV